ncbi:MAG TPA: DUF4019 domain-containing protein [Candidatus Angelobacter sp.]|nr:DUF4019 domain-containing protein [Candidatus Angelobacter sp.]
MRTGLKLITLALFLSAFAAPAYPSEEKEKAATDAAVPWLALVDSGQYGESWFQASSDFRGAASKEQWVHALNTVRAPLGKLVSRQLKSASYTTRLPNVHDGEYVVLQYETSYEKAPAMLEVVVMVLEKNREWKVTGYFIKPSG